MPTTALTSRSADSGGYAGLGEQAFTYVGANGPGVVVMKANKVVILELSYTDPGERALPTLAQQAAARVG